MKDKTALKILIAAIAIALLVFALCCYFSDYDQAKKYYELGGDNPALFLAIARVESSFLETAISSKGAMGLCQIMPTTAEWCAGRMGISYDANMLLVASYNAAIANYYINYLSDKFSDENAVICAYNAGEGNVLAWLKDESIYKNGEFVEIPFPETKNYLKKVQTYQKKYQTYMWLFGWN